MKRVTISDVAARAGVSKSTVSHALSGKRPISASTRLRIQQAIDALGYRPNPVAQRLAGLSPSRTIAFVFPLLTPRIAGLEMKFIASAAGVINQAQFTFLLLTHLDQNYENLRKFAASGLVDGVILMQVQLHDSRVELLQQLDVPFVLVGRQADNRDLAYVDADIDAAMWQGVAHLAGLGHQNIAYLHQLAPEFGFSVRAVQAFHAACQAYGVSATLQPCHPTPDHGRAAFEQVLAEAANLSAVITWNDMAMLGVVQAAQARGLAIPRDLSLICFDLSIPANLTPFQPTILDIRGDQTAAQAAQLMIDILEERPPAQTQILVSPRLVVGNSTQPAQTSQDS